MTIYVPDASVNGLENVAGQPKIKNSSHVF